MGRRLVTLVALLACAAVNATFLVLPRGSYEAIVVHHTASESGDYREIRRAHRRRGWFDAAYHLILSRVEPRSSVQATPSTREMVPEAGFEPATSDA